MDTKFNSFKSLKNKLLYGVSPEESDVLARELSRKAILLKAATYPQIPANKEISLAHQWSWPEAHHFLDAIAEAQKSTLIYEWSHLLKSKNHCLPANFLVTALDWSNRDLVMANYVLPVIGDLGQQLAGLFSDWDIFSKNQWQNAFAFSKNEKRLFAFKQFRQLDPTLAFDYFIQQQEHLKETEKRKCISLLKHKITSNEIKCLLDVMGTSKINFLLEFVQLSFSDHTTNYFQNNKKIFLQAVKDNTLDEIQFISLTNKEYNWSNLNKIKCIPTIYFEDEITAKKYIQWVETQDAETTLLESIQQNPSIPFLKIYFNHMLDSNKLTEDFPVQSLSLAMDHTSFNQACIQWIKQAGDQLDVEAFLHFIHLDKHFWSDELLARILEFRNHSKLENKYDFSIFWQLLPFKVNPNSVYLKSIPAECKIYFNKTLNFDTIIQFRRLIRK